MKYQYLISQSKVNLEINPPNVNRVVPLRIFEFGAKWMFDKLNENKKGIQFNQTINFSSYGLLKYGISLIAFLLSAMFFFRISYLLLPFSIIVFYFVEVHFLFLFPILIDNVKKPIWTSIKQTYKTGLLTSLITVIPIGCYMVFGFLNLKAPFRNWYVGCLAILIWYKNEIRNRI